MEVWHEGAAMGAEFYKFVAEQVRLHTADAVTFDTLHSVEGTHEIDELLVGGLAEVAYVHTCNHNFLAAFRRCLLSLFHKGSNSGIARQTACVGYGAVGAEVVTTVLHLEEIACAVAARTRRGERLYLARVHGVVLMQRVHVFTALLTTLLLRPGIAQEL